jgi:hypothetical protein
LRADFSSVSSGRSCIRRLIASRGLLSLRRAPFPAGTRPTELTALLRLKARAGLCGVCSSC